MLESVQRRWTKKVNGMTNWSYRERLRALNLFSIKGKLLSADLIKYWRAICDKARVCDLSELFVKSPSNRTRGHRFKLLAPRCLTDILHKFFNVLCVHI